MSARSKVLEILNDHQHIFLSRREWVLVMLPKGMMFIQNLGDDAQLVFSSEAGRTGQEVRMTVTDTTPYMSALQEHLPGSALLVQFSPSPPKPWCDEVRQRRKQHAIDVASVIARAFPTHPAAHPGTIRSSFLFAMHRMPPPSLAHADSYYILSLIVSAKTLFDNGVDCVWGGDMRALVDRMKSVTNNDGRCRAVWDRVAGSQTLQVFVVNAVFNTLLTQLDQSPGRSTPGTASPSVHIWDRDAREKRRRRSWRICGTPGCMRKDSHLGPHSGEAQMAGGGGGGGGRRSARAAGQVAAAEEAVRRAPT